MLIVICSWSSQVYIIRKNLEVQYQICTNSQHVTQIEFLYIVNFEKLQTSQRQLD